MADAATEVPSDYVMIKRKKTIFFLYLEAEDTVHDLRARINHVTKVPTTDVKFFIDKDGEVPIDENKMLKDQKIVCDDTLYMVYKKEGTDEWEAIDLDGTGGEPKPVAE